MNPLFAALGLLFVSVTLSVCVCHIECPSLQALLTGNQGNPQASDGGCRLVTTSAAGGTLPMSLLFHAVLNKMPSRAVTKVRHASITVPSSYFS